MKNLTAVQTEEQAISALQSWLTENETEELLHANTYIEPCETRCACGQTTGMHAWFEGSDKMASIAICEHCGE